MARTVGDLSPAELEHIMERAIDRRMQMWLEHLMDVLSDDEERAELRPEFAESLRHAITQADRGETIDLKSFREQLGR